jgi:hypothetical protein
MGRKNHYLSRKQMSHYDMHHKIYTLKQDVTASIWHGHHAEPEFTYEVWKRGTKVKVVMCSRFGDVGITKDLKATHGYDARVEPEMLEEIK